MHTGGHFDFGAYALRNNGNLLNYVKTKVGGVLGVEMLLSKGTKISKHYFPHDSCVVEFFKEIANHLNSYNALNKLNRASINNKRFDFVNSKGIDIAIIVKSNNMIISCFPNI